MNGQADAVDGIEVDVVAAREASGRLRKVVHADLNQVRAADLAAQLSPPYDVIIAADVLEHLVDPWRAAKELAVLLRPGGIFVVSIPNVRVLTVSGPLLVRGNFGYADRGVLDRTHLRFFTRSTAVQMLEGAGLEIRCIRRSEAWWRSRWKQRIGRALGDLGCEQFLIRAQRAP